MSSRSAVCVSALASSVWRSASSSMTSTGSGATLAHRNESLRIMNAVSVSVRQSQESLSASQTVRCNESRRAINPESLEESCLVSGPELTLPGGGALGGGASRGCFEHSTFCGSFSRLSQLPRKRKRSSSLPRLNGSDICFSKRMGRYAVLVIFLSVVIDL
jgi:hypothetical protein